MDKLLIIVRHGARGLGSGDPSLSDVGSKQMQSLKSVINTLLHHKAKDAHVHTMTRLLLSFSFRKRALQSIDELRVMGDDLVVTDLFLTTRRDIVHPKKILDKILGLATHYGANVIVAVAHGEMPAVIAETVHLVVTGKKHDRLRYPQEACGYVANLTTGDVTPIRFDDLDPKPEVPLPAPQTARPVIRGGPVRTNTPAVIKRAGLPAPKLPGLSEVDLPDDDIPF